MKTVLSALKFYLNREENSSDEMISFLRVLNTQVKKESTRKEAMEILEGIRRALLTVPGIDMYHAYLLSKGFRFQYEDTGDVAYLIKAAKASERVFTIAEKHAIRIKNPKYYFVAGYNFWLLASCGDEVNLMYYRKVSATLRKAWGQFQTPSIRWLYEQVRSYANTHNLIFHELNQNR